MAYFFHLLALFVCYTCSKIKNETMSVYFAYDKIVNYDPSVDDRRGLFDYCH